MRRERGERGFFISVWRGILSEMGLKFTSRNSRKIILERNILSPLTICTGCFKKGGNICDTMAITYWGGYGWIGLAKNNRHTYYTAHTLERDQFSLSRLRREGTNKSFSPSSRPRERERYNTTH
eukprot:sb/3475759/